MFRTPELWEYTDFIMPVLERSPTTDPESAVEQTRRRIAQMTVEIQSLSQSDLDPPEFLERFLQLLGSAVGARAGAVWLLNPNGQLALAARHGIEETNVLQDSAAKEENLRLVRDVLTTGQARCLAADHQSIAGFSVPCVVTLAPLHQGEECAGVVQLFQKPETSEQARAGYLQFVEQMAGHASRFLSDKQRKPADVGVDPFWRELSEFTLELQASLKPKQVAAVAANDGRLLLKCDRLSVAYRRGRKLAVQAVSGQDTVDRRANLIRAMVRLAEKVIPSREVFEFGESKSEPPPSLQEPLADFLAESGTRRLTIVPLFEPEPFIPDRERSESDIEKKRERKQPFGCLIAEQLSHNEGSGNLTERAEILGDHIAASLANARAHHRIFLQPLFSAIGAAKERLYGRRLLKTIAFTSVIAAVVASLVLIQWDYRVEAEGRLMPSVRQTVFAPSDGEVMELFIDDGAEVKQGQPLLRIQNDELNAQLTVVSTELKAKQEEEEALRSQILVAARSPKKYDLVRLQGQLMETTARIRGLVLQQHVLEQRVDALTIRAPIAGIVTTFRVRELLNHRPAQRGEVLLEIADHKGKWRLELEVEEHRMGHLLNAQKEQRDPLAVEFLLATSPTETYEGRLQTVATRPKRLPQKGSLVEVFVSVPEERGPQHRIGAEVRAKIHCGKRSLGYVLIGDGIEFVRRRWWW